MGLKNIKISTVVEPQKDEMNMPLKNIKNLYCCRDGIPWDFVESHGI